MKTLRCVFALFVFVGFLMVGCSDEQQSPVTPIDQGSLQKLVRINFTSHSYNTIIIEPGEIRYAGGNVFIRNREDYLNVESTNLFINATDGIITYNANLNAETGEGHEWGTITFSPDAYPDLEFNGIWNGQVTLTSYPPNPEWTLVAQLVGHIRGGSSNGMQVFWDITVIYHDPGALNWVGDATGYIQYNDK